MPERIRHDERREISPGLPTLSPSRFGASARTVYGNTMVGLSVALGRFFEALFWAILGVAGSIAGAVLGVILLLLGGWMGLRWAWRRRKAR